MARRTRLLTLALAAAAVMLGLVVIAGEGGSGKTAAANAAQGESKPTPVVSPTALPLPTATPQPTAVKVVMKKSPATRLVAAELPRQLVVPAIGVNAAFEYVGLASDGAMDVPKDANKVAWYQLGPRPGEQGNAVVAGHVDWGGKAAVFWGLRNLQPGDDVQIVAMDDRSYEFTVQWSRWYPASGTSAADEVFGQSDASELTLITCGGEFDSTSRQYLSRLVVRALRKQ